MHRLKFKNEIAIGAEASYLVARKTRGFYGDGYRHKKHCPNIEIDGQLLNNLAAKFLGGRQLFLIITCCYYNFKWV